MSSCSQPCQRTPSQCQVECGPQQPLRYRRSCLPSHLLAAYQYVPPCNQREQFSKSEPTNSFPLWSRIRSTSPFLVTLSPSHAWEWSTEFKRTSVVALQLRDLHAAPNLQDDEESFFPIVSFWFCYWQSPQVCSHNAIQAHAVDIVSKRHEGYHVTVLLGLWEEVDAHWRMVTVWLLMAGWLRHVCCLWSRYGLPQTKFETPWACQWHIFRFPDCHVCS